MSIEDPGVQGTNCHLIITHPRVRCCSCFLFLHFGALVGLTLSGRVGVLLVGHYNAGGAAIHVVNGVVMPVAQVMWVGQNRDFRMYTVSCVYVEACSLTL